MIESQPMKVCSKCLLPKPVGTDFYWLAKKQRWLARCKTCEAAVVKSRRKANPERWRKTNREAHRRWVQKNRVKCALYERGYRQKHRVRIALREKNYSTLHRVRISARIRDQRRRDPQARLGCRLRTSLWYNVRIQGGAKNASTVALTGCSIQELRTHLESLFEPGMTWLNYGKGDDKWNIDHIHPCASFDLTNPEQQKQCFHWTNLQPLWQIDNHRKSDLSPVEWEQRKAKAQDALAA